jgi:hypothetical protein
VEAVEKADSPATVIAFTPAVVLPSNLTAQNIVSESQRILKAPERKRALKSHLSSLKGVKIVRQWREHMCHKKKQSPESESPPDLKIESIEVQSTAKQSGKVEAQQEPVQEKDVLQNHNINNTSGEPIASIELVESPASDKEILQNQNINKIPVEPTVIVSTGQQAESPTAQKDVLQNHNINNPAIESIVSNGHETPAVRKPVQRFLLTAASSVKYQPSTPARDNIPIPVTPKMTAICGPVPRPTKRFLCEYKPTPTERKRPIAAINGSNEKREICHAKNGKLELTQFEVNAPPPKLEKASAQMDCEASSPSPARNDELELAQFEMNVPPPILEAANEVMDCEASSRPASNGTLDLAQFEMSVPPLRLAAASKKIDTEHLLPEAGGNHICYCLST